MTCTIILSAWQCVPQKSREYYKKNKWKKLEKLNSTFFLDQMPVNKSFASCN